MLMWFSMGFIKSIYVSLRYGMVMVWLAAKVCRLCGMMHVGNTMHTIWILQIHLRMRRWVLQASKQSTSMLEGSHQISYSFEISYQRHDRFRTPMRVQLPGYRVKTNQKNMYVSEWIRIKIRKCMYTCLWVACVMLNWIQNGKLEYTSSECEFGS